MCRIQKGVLDGRKVSNRHSTVIKAAQTLISAAKALEAVSKVVLGPIQDIGPGAQRLKFTPIPAGLKVAVRGSSAIQIIFVYTAEPSAVRQRLEEAWQEART